MGVSANQVVVFANLRALDGRIDELLEHFAPVVARNRTEIGCLVFDVHVAHEDPDLLMMHEIWETPADFERHLAQEHVALFLERMTTEGFGEQQPLHPGRRVL